MVALTELALLFSPKPRGQRITLSSYRKSSPLYVILRFNSRLKTNRRIQLNTIKTNFNKANGAKQVSLADLIVLSGNAALEKAAAAAGYKNITVPFTAETELTLPKTKQTLQASSTSIPKATDSAITATLPAGH